MTSRLRAATDLTATPHGVRLERLVAGAGEPVTVFAHGLAGDIAGTRPLGSGVTGRKVFFHFRGHGRSDRPPGPWHPIDFARDLAAVADATGATRAVGASLGAAALCRLLADRPDRFERVVFFLPPVLDEPRAPVLRQRFERLVTAVHDEDAAAIADLIAAELPDLARTTPDGQAYVRRRVGALLRDGLAAELAVAEPALPDLGLLAAVRAPALVIGCAGDELHPVAAAHRLAAALPHAQLHVHDGPGVLWTDRAGLRRRLSAFLNVAG